ncbi:MAG: neutral zinc metallopeptidase [Myxococcota bacterium]
MRLGSDGDSSNVEDRRGEGRSMRGGGPRVRLGIGGIVAVAALSFVLKRNLFVDLGLVGAPDRPVTQGSDEGRRAREEASKATAVAAFNDIQRTWKSVLGDRYTDAKLVLFWDETRSGCGAAGAEMGPFYCPADEKVYIDLGFYDELKTRFGAPGDFAQAYVIAHEVGHHVQRLLGTEAKMRAAQREEPSQKNALSVRLELQADCYAGVWGHTAEARKLLDPGDLEEGLGAAAAVGDDRLQKAANRRVTPETWTHGSSAQRSKWFRVGFASGKAEDCDTFGAAP